MLTDLKQYIHQVLTQHWPNPPAAPEEISAWEAAHGAHLNDELRAFYLACNGAHLFRKMDSPYRFLPLRDVVSGHDAIFGPEPGPECPPYIFALVDVWDGNYIGFDARPGHNAMIDLFHESWPEESRVVASSLKDFLRRALRSNGWHYWLGETPSDWRLDPNPP